MMPGADEPARSAKDCLPRRRAASSATGLRSSARPGLAAGRDHTQAAGGELMGIRHAVLGIGIAWLAACAAADREEGDTRADGAAPRAESALLVSTAWLAEHRSEERRVGKEWRRRQAAEQETRSEEGGV